MPLRGLLGRLGAGARPFGDLEVVVDDVTCDSRAVSGGSLMVCIAGTSTDGHLYADDALSRGAVALVVEREIPECARVPGFQVDDARHALAVIADRLQGHPSQRLDVFGVTGTNGKTSCVSFAASIARRAGLAPGVIGTLGLEQGATRTASVNTTPGADRFQAALARMAKDGARAAMVEVSSHALDMHRTTATAFRVVALTNLTRDHLDWHETLEAYREAKARLFRRAAWDVDPEAPDSRPVLAILPVGEVGDWFAARSDLPVTRYGEEGGDWRIEIVELRQTGGRARLCGPGTTLALDVNLPGRFNVRNAAVAAIACHFLGVPAGAIEQGIRDVGTIPGRMERVDAGQPFAVLVDYAHTPDALEVVLGAARELTRGRLICVIGAGGDRDRGKRHEMARVAAALADEVVLTSDNPRSEDPEAILDDMAAGLAGARAGHRREADRRAAVRLAIAHARAGDTVVIAGKGHETTQEISGERIPMDDRIVAREALASLGFSPGESAT